MIYTCKDCSHQSTTRFPNGKCPACDSYNISSTNKIAESSAKDRKPKTKIEIVILILLWVSYSSLIVLFGAEFTRSFANFMDGNILPDVHAKKSKTPIEA